jgi:acetyl-CoA carboxylase biotin carboxyl carrier protein
MDAHLIKEIIGLVAQTELAEVELEHHGVKLRIKRYPDVQAPSISYELPVVQQKQAPLASYVPPPVTAPAAPPAPAAEVAAPAAPPTPAAPPAAKTTVVRSPMIGTFYRSPGPGKDVFVNEGDSIKPGQTLCIIEAMKLFNEIEAEVAGKIVRILVANATPVEYDQPLFEVEPA